MDNAYAELPLGLGMALARNQKAMQYFSSLSPDKRHKIIEMTADINSSREMERFVGRLKDL